MNVDVLSMVDAACESVKAVMLSMQNTEVLAAEALNEKEASSSMMSLALRHQ